MKQIVFVIPGSIFCHPDDKRDLKLDLRPKQIPPVVGMTGRAGLK